MNYSYLFACDLIWHVFAFCKESCGCHLREESQTEENEAKRDDENFSFVSVWEHKGSGNSPELHKEALQFENVTPSQRSYK